MGNVLLINEFIHIYETPLAEAFYSYTSYHPFTTTTQASSYHGTNNGIQKGKPKLLVLNGSDFDFFTAMKKIHSAIYRKLVNNIIQQCMLLLVSLGNWQHSWVPFRVASCSQLQPKPPTETCGAPEDRKNQVQGRSMPAEVPVGKHHVLVGGYNMLQPMPKICQSTKYRKYCG